MNHMTLRARMCSCSPVKLCLDVESHEKKWLLPKTPAEVASLIEAAPDLLKTCEGLAASAAELSRRLDDGLLEHEWGNTDAVGTAMLAARAAIAKAKGE